MGFILANWRIIAIVLAVLSLLGALWGYGHTKYKEGFKSCQQAQEAAEIKAKETRDEIKTKNSRVRISDIDKRLIARWLRDQ